MQKGRWTSERPNVPVANGAGGNDFDASNIHYKSHWKGWALNSRLFWAPNDTRVIPESLSALEVKDNIGGQWHSFDLFLFHRLVMRRVHLTYSILLGGCLAVWTWVGLEPCLFWSALTCLWLLLKLAGDLCHSPMGIDSADTRQQPKGEICMDKSHLLSNNPARQ
jgi:hypothetical protein